MKVIRWLLGRIILLINALIPVQGRVVRSEAEQQAVNREAAALALYQYEACPFCVKVRRTMRRLGLGIELRDAKRVAIHRESLLRDGGNAELDVGTVGVGELVDRHFGLLLLSVTGSLPDLRTTRALIAKVAALRS